MKKRKFCFLLLILIIISISGCNEVKKSNEIQTQSTIDSIDKGNYSVGFGYTSDNILDCYSYKDGYLSINLFYDNTGEKMTYGIMVYVNGKVQKLVNDNGQEENIYPVVLEKNEKKNFSVKFIPQGYYGDKAEVTIVSMMNPLFSVNKDTVSFGNFMRTTSLNTYISDFCVEMINTESYENIVDFNGDFLTKYQIIQNGNAINLYDTTLCMNIDVKNLYQSSTKSGINVPLYIFGGQKNEYFITAYINNHPVQAFNEKESISITSKPDKMQYVDIEIDRAVYEQYLENGYGKLYVIAIPKNKEVADSIIMSNIIIVD